jgi:hypothetical protein
MHQLGQCTEHSDPREQAQAEVPKGHTSTPIPSWPVAHHMLSPENQNTIGSHSKDGDHGVVPHPVQQWDGVIFLFESECISQQQGTDLYEISAAKKAKNDQN